MLVLAFQNRGSFEVWVGLDPTKTHVFDSMTQERFGVRRTA
jgi:hypothetical protein